MSINRFDVAKAYLPSVTLESLNIASATDQVYSTFLDSLATKNIQKTMISDGDSLDFGIKVKAKAFFPVSANDFAYSKASFPEMAIQIALGSTSVTFIGDASKKVQKYIAASSSLVFSYSVPVSFESASSPDSIVSAVVSVEANHLEAGASLTNDSNDSNQSGPSSATSSSLLIVSTSASPDQMSAELVNLLKPNYLIYSKSASRDFSKPKNLALTAPSASSTLKSSKTKASMKMPVDPLESVPIENRFNLKEKGEIHIISDGRHIVIE